MKTYIVLVHVNLEVQAETREFAEELARAWIKESEGVDITLVEAVEEEE